MIGRALLAQAMYEAEMAEAYPAGDWLPWEQRRPLPPIDYLRARYLERAVAIIARLDALRLRPALPRCPWNVLWIEGRTLIDADGRKIATLLGAQPQREAVAEALIAAFGAPEEGAP